jgi:uncharacterized protein YcaQ
MVTTPTLQLLRRQAVLATFPPTVPLGRVFARLGFVQADPIRAPARAQDLILRHRATDYRAGDLERRFSRLGLEEGYLHAYGFMTPAVKALLLPRYDTTAEDGRHLPDGLAAEVLAFVQASGPTHPAALAERFGREREVNGWGGLSKATTRALYRLQHHGLLRVLRRDSGVRVYEAVPISERAHTDAERIEQITLLLARILAPVPSQTLAATLAPILRSLLGPRTRSSAIADLSHSGALLAEETDGLRYLTPADLPMSGRTQKTVRFLAPFDPLVWDRRRFEHLYGWRYRFEAYTPPAKRKLGYYAMPLLWGNEVIGWVNVARSASGIDVQAGYVTGRPDEAGFAAAFDAEVARMQRFLSADEPSGQQ